MGVAENINSFSFRRDRRDLLRVALALGAAMAAGPVVGAMRRAPTVLFICQFGSVKSAVARELMRSRAAARGVRARVISRGVTPEQHASPQLLAQLRREGVDPDRQPLTRLDAATLRMADIVVLFDRLPPGLARPDARDWSDMPSMNDHYPAARAFLDPRIETLLDEIDAPRSGRD